MVSGRLGRRSAGLAVVGAPVGTGVGASVGTAVGASIGTAVGNAVGTVIGAGIGTGIGPAHLGGNVGVDVRPLLGHVPVLVDHVAVGVLALVLRAGLLGGRHVGVDVAAHRLDVAAGARVGTTVRVEGTTVSTDVGTVIGTSVGAAIGATVRVEGTAVSTDVGTVIGTGVGAAIGVVVVGAGVGAPVRAAVRLPVPGQDVTVLVLTLRAGVPRPMPLVLAAGRPVAGVVAGAHGDPSPQMKALASRPARTPPMIGPTTGIQA